MTRNSKPQKNQNTVNIEYILITSIKEINCNDIRIIFVYTRDYMVLSISYSGQTFTVMANNYSTL